MGGGKNPYNMMLEKKFRIHKFENLKVQSAVFPATMKSVDYLTLIKNDVLLQT